MYIPEGSKLPAVPPEPDIDPDLEIILDAFYALSMARPVGHAGPQAIPPSEIISECRLRGIVDVELAATAIRTMDYTFLEWLDKQPKKKA